MNKTAVTRTGPIAAAALAASMSLTGCATTDGAENPDNQNKGKVVGALLGAAIGAALNRKDPAKGAAIGAAVGLAAGYMFDKYTVKQMRSADEVEEAYRLANAGQLPDSTTVAKYATHTEPTGVVTRGGELKFVSDVEVIRGTTAGNQADVIEQELVLFDPSGEGEKRIRKPALESSTASGAYLTEFTFRPSESMAQGVYPFKTILYLNGEQVGESSGEIQVASVESGTKDQRLA